MAPASCCPCVVSPASCWRLIPFHPFARAPITSRFWRTPMRQLHAENVALRSRLSAVKAVTDDDIDDEAAGQLRAKLAAEVSESRRERPPGRS